MNKTSENIYTAIIDKVAFSFGNILETLFRFRKWGAPGNRKRMENCVRFYLSNRSSQFWSVFEDMKGNKRSEAVCCRDVIRFMDETLNIRDMSKSEIMDIFREPERFNAIMEGRGTTALQKGPKATTASQPSINRKKVSPDSTGKPSSKLGNRGGIPRIGPGIRLYGSNLSKAQERANLRYWQDHQEELYNG